MAPEATDDEGTRLTILEHADRETFEQEHGDEYINIGVAAKLVHHTDNEETGPAKHAILLGDDAIIVEGDNGS